MAGGGQMKFTSVLGEGFLMEGPDDDLLYHWTGITAKVVGSTHWSSLVVRFSDEYLEWIGQEF